MTDTIDTSAAYTVTAERLIIPEWGWDIALPPLAPRGQASAAPASLGEDEVALFRVYNEERVPNGVLIELANGLGLVLREATRPDAEQVYLFVPGSYANDPVSDRSETELSWERPDAATLRSILDYLATFPAGVHPYPHLVKRDE